uniref:Uncharacterized protein n=1 Tax=Arundo donax TaxID=35708 RepID=A0A0A9AK15_ARUDO
MVVHVCIVSKHALENGAMVLVSL